MRSSSGSLAIFTAITPCSSCVHATGVYLIVSFGGDNGSQEKSGYVPKAIIGRIGGNFALARLHPQCQC
jgi:hypothetical protein